ncbi:MAG: MBL fold metallo-hydrolase [bacterium]
MEVKFWGTRGSIATTGAEIQKYGGNTACVEVTPDSGDKIIIDAGTGIFQLGLELIKGPFGRGMGKAHILISHTHWDHIVGLPFFEPAYIPGNEITIYGHGPIERVIRNVYEEDIKNMRAEISFRELNDAETRIDGITLRIDFLNHIEVRGVLGFRLESGGKVVTYTSDIESFHNLFLKRGNLNETGPISSDIRELDRLLENIAEDMDKRVVELARGASLLIHDAQYTPQEYMKKVGWGHSTPQEALEVAEKAKVERLVLFHHDPLHTDDFLDEIAVDVMKRVLSSRASFAVYIAREGMKFTF